MHGDVHSTEQRLGGSLVARNQFAYHNKKHQHLRTNRPYSVIGKLQLTHICVLSPSLRSLFTPSMSTPSGSCEPDPGMVFDIQFGKRIELKRVPSFLDTKESRRLSSDCLNVCYHPMLGCLCESEWNLLISFSIDNHIFMNAVFQFARTSMIVGNHSYHQKQSFATNTWFMKPSLVSASVFLPSLTLSQNAGSKVESFRSHESYHDKKIVWYISDES